MGKFLALVLGLADLGLLALLLTYGGGNVWREAGLVTSILLIAAIAWVTAFLSALYRSIRTGRDWRWILLLLTLIWLPALPVLAYALSPLYPRFSRRSSRSRWSLPPADPALEIARIGRGQAGRRLPRSRKRAA